MQQANIYKTRMHFVRACTGHGEVQILNRLLTVLCTTIEKLGFPLLQYPFHAGVGIRCVKGGKLSQAFYRFGSSSDEIRQSIRAYRVQLGIMQIEDVQNF